MTSRSALRAPAHCERAFVLLIWQMKHDKWVKWQNSHGAGFSKTTVSYP
jgi:hypothetical protein